PFYDSLTWVFRELQKHIDSGRLDEDSVLWPGKAFAIQSTEGQVEYVFVPFGAEVPQHATALNLLTPEVFVSMLSNGYFPIGNAEREHTNQTLAEHDLAHMAGFVSKPAYTKAVRQAFRIVGEKMRTNPRVYAALQEFDSAYSLRLYYMIEVFTEIPPASRDRLQELIEIPLDQAPDKAAIDAFLLAKAADPEEFYRYLANLYWNYHHLVNPLGGESRDVLNRKRKFQRDGSVGSFYDGVSKLSSKFARNSMYSLFLNARAMLENVRSNHPEFERSITAVHTPFIGALLGTSQLEVEDWVLAAVEEELDPSSKLYRYIHNSNLWDQNHLLYRAYCGAEFDEILD
ncbi:MAG: hypothetical protein KDK78_08215, partial [Chlamydiia bacterium]|nr:hypothetical protein [Chlamydiia bacterium]